MAQETPPERGASLAGFIKLVGGASYLLIACFSKILAYMHDIIASIPENYEERLSAIFAGEFRRLWLFALDPYDIALAKIERSIDRDREDVKSPAKAVPLDMQVFEDKVFQTAATFLRNSRTRGLTLWLWIEINEETKNQK